MKNGVKIFLILSTLYPLYVTATDLFVTQTGSGNICSQSSPCSLGSALGSAGSGDTIYMGEGNYTIATSPMITLDQNPIQLIGGWDGVDSHSINVYPDVHVSVIDGNDNYQCMQLDPGSSVNIVGLTIANCRSDNNGSAIYGMGVDYLQLEDSKLVNNFASSSLLSKVYGGALFFQGDRIMIENTLFDDNGVLAVAGCYGGAVAIKDANATISKNRFTHNAGYDIAAFYYDGVTKDSSKLLFNENNITDNGLKGLKTRSQKGIVLLKDVNATFGKNLIANNFYPTHDSLVSYFFQTKNIYFQFYSNFVFHNTFKSHLFDLRDTTVNMVNNAVVQNYAVGSNDTTIYSINTSSVYKMYLIHNTFADNNSTNCLFRELDGSYVIDNNIFANCDIALNNGHSNMSASNNLADHVGAFAGGCEASGVMETDTVIGSAHFLNPSAGDYHIRKNSDAQNRALATTLSEDFDGDGRPQESVADIGADEYTPGREYFNTSVLMYLLN